MGGSDAREERDQSNKIITSVFRWLLGVVWLVGLAWSIIAFTDSLEMGHDAIEFAIAKLSEIQDWQGFVLALAEIFHGALEKWREAVEYLLTYLPFNVPAALHDPLSVLFFALARIWQRRKKLALSRDYRELLEQRSVDVWYSNYLTVETILRTVLLYFVIPMIGLIVIDRRYYAAVGGGMIIDTLRLTPYAVAFLGYEALLRLLYWFTGTSVYNRLISSLESVGDHAHREMSQSQRAKVRGLERGARIARRRANIAGVNAWIKERRVSSSVTNALLTLPVPAVLLMSLVNHLQRIQQGFGALQQSDFGPYALILIAFSLMLRIAVVLRIGRARKAFSRLDETGSSLST